MCEAINTIKIMNPSIIPQNLLVPHLTPASPCPPTHPQATTDLLSVTIN